MLDTYSRNIWSVIDTLRSQNIPDDFIKESVLKLSRTNPDPMALVAAHRIVKEMHVTPVAGRIGVK